MPRANRWSQLALCLAAMLWGATSLTSAADDVKNASPKLLAVRDDAGRVTRVDVLGLAPAALQAYQQDQDSAAAAFQVVTAGAAAAADDSLPAIVGAYAVSD